MTDVILPYTNAIKIVCNSDPDDEVLDLKILPKRFKNKKISVKICWQGGFVPLYSYLNWLEMLILSEGYLFD